MRNKWQRRLECIKVLKNEFGKDLLTLGDVIVNSFNNDRFFHKDIEDWPGEYTIDDVRASNKISYLIDNGYLKELEPRHYIDSQDYRNELEQLTSNIASNEAKIKKFQEAIKECEDEYERLKSMSRI